MSRFTGVAFREIEVAPFAAQQGFVLKAWDNARFTAVGNNHQLYYVDTFVPWTCSLWAGYASCEPSIDEVRGKVERLFNSAFLTSHSVVSLEKFDSRGFEMQGRKMYEMRMVVVLNYSGDKLRCRRSLCPELQNYLVKVDETTKEQPSRAGSFLNKRIEGGAKARYPRRLNREKPIATEYPFIDHPLSRGLNLRVHGRASLGMTVSGVPRYDRPWTIAS